MAHPTDIRRLALLAIYQIDATGGHTPTEPDLIAALQHAADLVDDDPEAARFVRDGVTYSTADRRKAALLALAAWAAHQAADAELADIAPDWPPRRQAPIDRAILRLAHHEIRAGLTPFAAAIDEAVELAKAFSTERSPKFINGVLGALAHRPGTTPTPAPTPAPAAGQGPGAG